MFDIKIFFSIFDAILPNSACILAFHHTLIIFASFINIISLNRINNKKKLMIMNKTIIHTIYLAGGFCKNSSSRMPGRALNVFGSKRKMLCCSQKFFLGFFC